MNRQKFHKTWGRLFPTVFCNSTKFNTIQILMSIIFASLAGINCMSRLANSTEAPFVKVNLCLIKAINENAISGKLKKYEQKGARLLQQFLLLNKSKQLKSRGLKDITIDADSTVGIVYGNQEMQKKALTRKKVAKNYHHLLVFVSELKMLYHTWFRAGAVHTAKAIGWNLMNF